MKLQIEASIDTFLVLQNNDFHFIANAHKPNIEAIFYPSEDLFGGLLTRLILTSVIAAVLLFMAVAGIVVVNSGKIKNPTVIPIYVFSGLGVLLLVWAYQTYQKYEQTKDTIQKSQQFENDYREGIYFLKQGVVHHSKKKITCIPYKNIERIKFSKRSAGRGFAINQYTFELNTGGSFKIEQNFYNVSAVQLHKHFREHDVKIL